MTSRDWQWLGQPIDFLIWDGHEGGELTRLVVVEVKTTTSKGDGLTTPQRRMRYRSGQATARPDDSGVSGP